jgi:SNF2 family DNA or RNA helicase
LVPTYTDHEFFFSQDWQAVRRQQAEDRAHRKGTRTILRVTDLAVPGTVDVDIRAKVLQKLTDALQIQDVRAILKNVLNYGA